MQQDTMSNPLSFFIDFIELRQLDKFRASFYDIESANPSTTKIDMEAEKSEWSFATSLGYESGEVHFKDFLRDIFMNEKIVAMDDIADHLQSSADIKSYIVALGTRIDLLLSKAKQYQDLSRYPQVIDVITELKNDLLIYMPQEIKQVRLQPTTQVPDSTRFISGLKWKGNPTKLAAYLYEGLTEYGFIDGSTSASAIENLFNPIQIDTKEKIKWIKLVNGSLSKMPLFRLFYTLNKNELTEESIDKEKMYQLIDLLFVDHEGKQFQNLKISIYSYREDKPTREERMIVRIVDSLTANH